MTTTLSFSNFDPNAVGQLGNGIFGLPFDAQSAQTVIVAVPWEVTTSYGDGTANGPDAIFEASAQVDLFHPDFGSAWKSGIALSPTRPLGMSKVIDSKQRPSRLLMRRRKALGLQMTLNW